MKVFNIFNRKPREVDHEPIVVDEWAQKQFEKNVIQGIKALKNGKSVSIMDNGRGYELALAIKQGYILEYQKYLAQQIEITGGSTISIKRNMNADGRY